MRGQYVLENKIGQVVRTFNWEGEAFTLIYLESNRRVEAVASTKELDKQKIPYVKLVETTVSEIKKKPLSVGHIGKLKWLEEVKTVSPSVPLTEDNSDDFKKALKWTAGIEIALLLLLLFVGHFINIDAQKVEPTLVTVVPRPVEVKPIPKHREIIEVTEHKEEKKNLVHHVTPHKVTRISPLRAKVFTHYKKQVPSNNQGESQILGSLEKADQTGGLKLNAMKTSKGVGLGGTEGSGGVQTSVYGSGLIAAPLGPKLS